MIIGQKIVFTQKLQTLRHNFLQKVTHLQKLIFYDKSCNIKKKVLQSLQFHNSVMIIGHLKIVTLQHYVII